MNKDFEQAYYWGKKAAVQGYYNAENLLAALCEDEGHYAKAAKWYHKAVERDGDDCDAMARLGYLYLHGYGVKKDLEQALAWYDRVGVGLDDEDYEVWIRLKERLAKKRNSGK